MNKQWSTYKECDIQEFQSHHRKVGNICASPWIFKQLLKHLDINILVKYGGIYYQIYSKISFFSNLGSCISWYCCFATHQLLLVESIIKSWSLQENFFDIKDNECYVLQAFLEILCRTDSQKWSSCIFSHVVP